MAPVKKFRVRAFKALRAAFKLAGSGQTVKMLLKYSDFSIKAPCSGFLDHPKPQNPKPKP